MIGEIAGRDHRRLLLGSVILTLTGVCALAATIGADARWLAALGHVIATQDGIPSGVPFAAAPTAHWPNVIALAELVFHWLESTMGDRGLVVANLLAVAIGLTLLARGATDAGATAAGTASALIIATLGALPSLVIVRDQLFSLVLFPALLVLLRNQSREPSRLIWLVVPLLAIWSNLHGAALIGLGVTGLYLALERLRLDPVTAIGVGILAALAVCVTPAGIHTIAYYHGVLTNVAAERGEQLWAPLTLSSPLDLLLIGAALALALAALRTKLTRPPVWELATIAALAIATISATRSGVWLLFFLVAPAARALRPRRTWNLLHIPMAVASLAAIGLVIARGPLPTGASGALVARAVGLAHGTPVLADDIVAEQIALAGGHVWVADPIDAFSHRDQAIYLDWTQGSSRGWQALRREVRVVLVQRGGAAERLMARTPEFAPVGSDRRVQLFVRVGDRPARSAR